MNKKISSVAAAIVLIAACDAPDTTAPPAAVSFAPGPPTGMTNGSGAFNIGAPGADIAFDLNAVARSDGSATGEVHYVTDLTAFGIGTIEIRFRVVCASTDRELGRAWIGGVVTENTSTNPTFVNDPLRQVGRDVWFRVEDNGNGGSGIADRSTQLGFEGSAGIITSLEYCAARLWPAPPAHPVVSGNIVVR